MKPYTIQITKRESQPGCWDVNDVDVFLDQEKIFSFCRHYPDFAQETTGFVTVGDKDYLVYSSNYTTLSFYNLTDRKPVELTAESEKQLKGFCPVHAHVPSYKIDTHHYTSPVDNKEKAFLVYYSESEFTGSANAVDCKSLPILQHDFAFVLGCVWGDDSRWWLNVLDLSEIEKGEVFYIKDFDGNKGWTYLPVPSNVTAKDCFSISYDGDDIVFDRKFLRIELSVVLRFEGKFKDTYAKEWWK